METQKPARLQALGWTDHFEAAFAELANESLQPARVSADYGASMLVVSASGNARATLSGALQKAARQVAVGDWVALRQRPGANLIVGILPRRTAVSRKAPDSAVEEQVLAANVDVMFIVSSLGSDFNLRRIERLLTVAYQSGAAPVILLTKTDLEDVAPYVDQLAPVAPGVPVLAVSALCGDGLDEVRAQVVPGKTAVLVGSSGVGKSTLINALLDADFLRTRNVHHSGQGRHTTSHRQLLAIPGGGLIIDTPGLREIQLWAGEEALGKVFADIEALARACRFNDCRHDDEPGCAVIATIAEGLLNGQRLVNYRKMQRELRSLEVRADIRLQQEERRRWKVIHRSVKEHMKTKRRWD